MERSGTNYQVSAYDHSSKTGRTTLHDKLALTGSEISINELPAGAALDFVHAHKQNEEVYMVIEGNGLFYIDGDEFEIAAGDIIRIAPAGKRCFKAAEASSMRIICVQTKAESLTQFTENDGIIVEARPSWFK